MDNFVIAIWQVADCRQPRSDRRVQPVGGGLLDELLRGVKLSGAARRTAACRKRPAGRRFDALPDAV